MISHLSGKLEHKEADHVVVDVGNIGYHVTVPASTIPRLPEIDQEIKLFTLQIVREDDISLYGFLTKEERNLFKILLKVNGVGPKAATAIIGAFNLDKLVTAITKGNVDLITSVPGIGKKTAQKIVIELKEKVSKAFGGMEASGGGSVDLFKGESQEVLDAVSALVALGYSAKEAKEMILKLEPKVLGAGTEIIIKNALQKVS
ncbi:MAG: Holliday junction branch migration protein RuvA [Candidatus Margulisbacteria bacterium]|nr:Holliday junction branch migration protein RuvA [Candidatus Margulisiibacteriota bacterium]MBU1022393.1 Holliday junction branch migration protein RuvA [Candidatus Margulisiibacteriota bacterium]MBU1729055.1 Holliday junction branch migration protein RuvA [Candidatus Margulisiibacteriota bacterium]MBU1954524.1 Holliday junction branch migration protein RuvA [Candidatus Margulisiibacteriota bacterium]